VPAGPTPNVMSCLRMASRYFFWATVLAVTPGFFSCVVTRSLTRFFSVSAPSCLTTFSAWVNSRFFTGEPAFSRVSSDAKKCLARSIASASPSSFDPAFARRGLDAEFGFERLQIARLVIEKLLRRAGVFEMKGFSCHEPLKLNHDAHFGTIQFNQRMFFQGLLNRRRLRANNSFNSRMPMLPVRTNTSL